MTWTNLVKHFFYFTPLKKGINVFAVLEEACSSLMVSAQDFRLSVLGLRPGLGCCVILFALNQCLSTNTGLSLTFSAREQQVHRWAKPFELNFFVRRIFLNGQTGCEKSPSWRVNNLFGAWHLWDLWSMWESSTLESLHKNGYLIIGWMWVMKGFHVFCLLAYFWF